MKSPFPSKTSFDSHIKPVSMRKILTLEKSRDTADMIKPRHHSSKSFLARPFHMMGRLGYQERAGERFFVVSSKSSSLMFLLR